MLRATGLDDADIAKPLVAVVHTWSNISPCNLNLRELAAGRCDGIRAAGGTPIEFNTIAVTDGIAMGTSGMRASLVSREVIADSIELAVNGHCLDAVRGAVRLRQDHSRRRDGPGADEHPGPGPVRRQHRARHAATASPITIQEVFEAVGAHGAGKIDDAELTDVEKARLPRRRRLRRPVHRQYHGDGADRAGPVADGLERHPRHRPGQARGGASLRRAG